MTEEIAQAGIENNSAARQPIWLRRPLRSFLIVTLCVAAASLLSCALLYMLRSEALAARREIQGELLQLRTEVRAMREFIKVVEADARRPRTWEYRIEAPSDYAFDSAMTEYGKEGWELVAARRASGAGAVSYEMIFKRPKVASASTSPE